MAGMGAAYGLVVAICLGTALGWGLDGWLKSSPWGLLAGIGLGFASGLMLVWQALQGPAEDSSPPK